MKRILFAAALAALFTGSARAEDKPAAAATPAPAVVSAAPTAEMAPATTSSGTRRGLIARLRDRRGGSGTMTSAPMMATPTMAAPVAPMPMPGTIVPKPMPSGTTGTLTPAGGTTTVTGSEIVTAGYSEPATGTMRRGLFSRIRNR
jgi:hypothetical protein